MQVADFVLSDDGGEKLYLFWEVTGEKLYSVLGGDGRKFLFLGGGKRRCSFLGGDGEKLYL